MLHTTLQHPMSQAEASPPVDHQELAVAELSPPQPAFEEEGEEDEDESAPLAAPVRSAAPRTPSPPHPQSSQPSPLAAFLAAAQATPARRRLSLLVFAACVVLAWEVLLRPAALGPASSSSSSSSLQTQRPPVSAVAGAPAPSASSGSSDSRLQPLPPLPVLGPAVVACEAGASVSGGSGSVSSSAGVAAGGSTASGVTAQPGSAAAVAAEAAAAQSSSSSGGSANAGSSSPSSSVWATAAAAAAPTCHHPRLASSLTDDELLAALSALCEEAGTAGRGGYPSAFLAAAGVAAPQPLAPAATGEDDGNGGSIPGTTTSSSRLMRLSTQTLARLRVVAMKKLTSVRRESGRSSPDAPASSSWPTQSVLSFEASPQYSDPYLLAHKHAILLTPYYLTWGAFDALVTREKVCRLASVALAPGGGQQEAAAAAAPWGWADLLDAGITLSAEVDTSELLPWMPPATAGDVVSGGGTGAPSSGVSPVVDEVYAPGTLRGEVVRRAAMALAGASGVPTLGGLQVPRGADTSSSSSHTGQEWLAHLSWTSASAGLGKQQLQESGGGEGDGSVAASQLRRLALHPLQPPSQRSTATTEAGTAAASLPLPPPLDPTSEPFEISPVLGCLSNWDELYPPEAGGVEEGTPPAPAVHRCLSDSAAPPPPLPASRFPSPCFPTLPFPALDHLVHELHADAYYRGSVGPGGASTPADPGALPVLVGDNTRRQLSEGSESEEGGPDGFGGYQQVLLPGNTTSSRVLAASDAVPPASFFHLPDGASHEASTNPPALVRLPRLPGWYFHNAEHQHAAWGGAAGSAEALGAILTQAPTTGPTDPLAVPVLERFAPPGTNLAVQQIIASFNSLMGDAGDTFSAADPRASFLRVSGCTIAGDPKRRNPSDAEADEAVGLSLSYGDNFYHFTEGATGAYPVVEWLRARAVTTTAAARDGGTGLTLYYWLHPPYEGFLSLSRLPLRNLLHAGKWDIRCKVCYMLDKGLCQDHSSSAALSGRDVMRHTLNLRAAAARGVGVDGAGSSNHEGGGGARGQLAPGGLLALRPGRVAPVWDAALTAGQAAPSSSTPGLLLTRPVVGVYPPPRHWVEPCCSSRRAPPLVVLIRRRGAFNRVWGNWPDVIDALTSLPIRLEVFDADYRLSAEATAAMMAAADAVVAVHGAGMSHCIAMRRGAVLIEVGPGGGASGCPCFTRIAMTNQLRYHSLLASAGPLGEPAPLPEPITGILRAELGLPDKKDKAL